MKEIGSRRRPDRYLLQPCRVTANRADQFCRISTWIECLHFADLEDVNDGIQGAVRYDAAHLLLGVAEHVIDMMLQLMSCLCQSSNIFTDIDFLESKNAETASAHRWSYQSLQRRFTRFQRVKIVLIAMKA